MAPAVPPTPLSLRRRFDLLTARLIALLVAVIDVLRRNPEAPAPMSELRYGAHPRETIQYIPPKPGLRPRTPIVFIHGGGFIILKSSLFTREMIGFANRGYPVFNVEYPLAPERPHPAMLLSLLAALGSIRERYPEIESVHLMGESAGGTLVMMLALFSENPSLLRDLGPSAPARVPLRVASVVPIYGILDRTTSRRNRFPGIDLMLEAYGGRTALEDQVTPENAITPMDVEFEDCPPSFLIAGANDRLADGTRALSRRLERMPVESTCRIYDGEIHGFFSMPWRPGYAEARRDIFEFLENHDTTTAYDDPVELAEASE